MTYLNTSLRIKFFLVVVAFTFPIAMLFSYLLEDKNKNIQFAEKEILGVEYIKSALPLSIELSRYIISTQVDNPSKIDEGLLTKAEYAQTIDKYFAALRKTHSDFAEPLNIAESTLATKGISNLHPNQLEAQWSSIKTMESSDPKKPEMVYNLLTDLSKLISNIGDSSNLILDPDLDSFYMMDALVVATPKLINNLYSYWIHSANSAPQQSPTAGGDKILPPKATSDLVISKDRSKVSFDHLSSSLFTAKSEDANFFGQNEILQKEVPTLVDDLLQKSELLLGQGQNQKSETSQEKLQRDLLSSIHTLFNVNAQTLTHLLTARIEDIKQARDQSILWVVGCWFLSVSLALILQRSIVRPMKKIFQHLKQVVNEINSSSQQLSSAAHKSATAASQEAAAIQESVAAMSEMTSMLTQTANHTAKASDAAQNAMEQSNRGVEIMDELTSSMSDIANANTKLKDIIKIVEDIASRTNVINDIVFKTQLLAVNASIEAARAGHHGKGFAVVANEVSNLAALSGKAADEIQNLLDQSKYQVVKIVQSTNDIIGNGKQVSFTANETFKDISVAIQEISEKVGQIFDATKEQEIGVKQTSQAMGELNEATSHNNTQARENAQLSEHIQKQGLRLSKVQKALSFVIFGTTNLTERSKSRVSGSELSNILGSNSASSTETEAPAKDSYKKSDAPYSEASHAPNTSKQLKSEIRPSLSNLASRISRKAGVPPLAQSQKENPQSFDNTTSDRFHWKNNYDIGVKSMNDEHKKLLDLMAGLEKSSQDSAPFSEQWVWQNKLEAYTVQHFANEETFFDSIAFPDAEIHKRIHKNLLDRFSQLSQEARLKSNFDEEFFRFLNTWLSAHIMGVDMQYGNYFNEMNNQTKLSA